MVVFHSYVNLSESKKHKLIVDTLYNLYMLSQTMFSIAFRTPVNWNDQKLKACLPACFKDHPRVRKEDCSYMFLSLKTLQLEHLTFFRPNAGFPGMGVPPN
jgi:hypothetical protein